jgi:hypothetical protein
MELLLAKSQKKLNQQINKKLTQLDLTKENNLSQKLSQHFKQKIRNGLVKKRLFDIFLISMKHAKLRNFQK